MCSSAVFWGGKGKGKEQNYTKKKPKPIKPHWFARFREKKEEREILI